MEVFFCVYLSVGITRYFVNNFILLIFINGSILKKREQESTKNCCFIDRWICHVSGEIGYENIHMAYPDLLK